MKVLISGAGISGNSLAFWLSKLGHDVTVIERFPALRATGLQIDLRGHGIEVMRRMGLEKAFRSLQPPEQGFEIVGSSGKRWAYFPANKSGEGLQSFTTDFEIMRGDFCRLLHDVTKDCVKYIFGSSIKKFEEEDGFVEVLFSDGTTDRFDILVGADGQGSRTRKMMMGSDTADGFTPLSGLHTGYFTIPKPIVEGEEYNSTGYIIPGNRAIMVRRHNADEIQAYLSFRATSERLEAEIREGVPSQKRIIKNTFQGAGWRTEELLEGMEDSENFYLERLGFVKLNSWSRGRVTLVGDAAYCPSATTGMGTTSAIVGAYILAGEIGKHCQTPGKSSDGGGNDTTKGGIEVALKAYEEKFRPFMDQVQHGLSADENPWSIMMPSTSLGIFALYCVMAIASFLRLDIMARWFLKEDVREWDLPEYEAMQG